MDLWMKSIWVLAALTVIACLVALAGTSGSGFEPAPAATSSTEYFTMRDPARATVDYGVREGQRTVIYSSHPAPTAP